MCFMQTKNRSEPAENRFSVALLVKADTSRSKETVSRLAKRYAII